MERRTKESLIAEALQRGYKPGIRVNSLGGADNACISEDPSLWWLTIDGHLRSSDDCMIYNKGNWAKILESSPIPENYQIY